MSNKRSRRATKATGIARANASSKSGIDRVSCAWRDAVGPGYAVGVTEGVARTVSGLDSGKYCR
jgi:hypothetical protein